MELGFGTEEYYKRMLDLQEKLRKSEEERLKLEAKFNQMMHLSRDAEQDRQQLLRHKYHVFLKEDKIRRERNENILRTLDRIENRAKTLNAKTERFKVFRKQYESYLKQFGELNNKIAESSISSHHHPVKKKLFPDTPFTESAETKLARLEQYIRDNFENKPLQFSQKTKENILNENRELNQPNTQMSSDNDSKESYEFSDYHLKDEKKVDVTETLGNVIEKELERLRIQPQNENETVNVSSSLRNYKDLVLKSQEKFGLKSDTSSKVEEDLKEVKSHEVELENNLDLEMQDEEFENPIIKKYKEMTRDLVKELKSLESDESLSSEPDTQNNNKLNVKDHKEQLEEEKINYGTRSPDDSSKRTEPPNDVSLTQSSPLHSFLNKNPEELLEVLKDSKVEQNVIKGNQLPVDVEDIDGKDLSKGLLENNEAQLEVFSQKTPKSEENLLEENDISIERTLKGLQENEYGQLIAEQDQKEILKLQNPQQNEDVPEEINLPAQLEYSVQDQDKSLQQTINEHQDLGYQNQSNNENVCVEENNYYPQEQVEYNSQQESYGKEIVYDQQEPVYYDQQIPAEGNVCYGEGNYYPQEQEDNNNQNYYQEQSNYEQGENQLGDNYTYEQDYNHQEYANQEDIQNNASNYDNQQYEGDFANQQYENDFANQQQYSEQPNDYDSQQYQENYASDQQYDYQMYPEGMYQQEYTEGQENVDTNYQSEQGYSEVEYANQQSQENYGQEIAPEYLQEEPVAEQEIDNSTEEHNVTQYEEPQAKSSEETVSENLEEESVTNNQDLQLNKSAELNETDAGEDCKIVDSLHDKPLIEKKFSNLADMLDTDTESFKQETKVSHDSDFEFA